MTVPQSEARRLDPAESTLSLPAHPAASSSKTVRRSISFKRLRSRSVHRQQTRDKQTEEVPSQTSVLRPPLPSTAHSAQGRLEGAVTVPSSSCPPQPFDWPKSSQYCACYCEENAYLLAQSLLRKVERRHGKERVDAEGRKWDVWVVVVSNQGKTVSTGRAMRIQGSAD
ncbi:hypothetical protein BDZ90DRAFT_39991 [Jaminaea rosea]|uniref:Protein N-terminal glutamine amidohydrolase alpha beta roll domain-containing protein n=1 Tax=Jaminaea rosea TaxID=1569628 RepID=A0A316URJ3_9BASI|nr:hypothetical protein BDZ90DRAFT_39991 [Jaminaea rosea]PWN26493.1 hypothetical protein BDZ90DRAFT_39991 [Jaminaea rosea]